MKHVKINSSLIMYLKADNPYVEVYTATRKYLERTSLDKILKEINSLDFIRIHRTYAVHINFIDDFYSNKVRVGNVLLPVSRRNSQKIADYLKK